MAPRAWWLAALAMAAVAAGGCKDRRLVQLENVRTEVCRCQDAACVNAALARLPTAGPKRERAAQRVAAEILECVAKVGQQPPEPDSAEAGPAEAGPAEAEQPEPAATEAPARR